MKTIGIINCGKVKRQGLKKYRADDLYTGAYFKKNLEYMREVVKPDEIYILSLYIPLYTTLVENTKSNVMDVDKVKDEYYTVMIRADEYIHSYDSGKHLWWGKPIIRKVFQNNMKRWIEDNNIDTDNVKVISLVSEEDHKIAIEPFFKHQERLFPDIKRVGYRLSKLTQELNKRRR